jgi:hypothetical protein
MGRGAEEAAGCRDAPSVISPSDSIGVLGWIDREHRVQGEQHLHQSGAAALAAIGVGQPRPGRLHDLHCVEPVAWKSALGELLDKHRLGSMLLALQHHSQTVAGIEDDRYAASR